MKVKVTDKGSTKTYKITADTLEEAFEGLEAHRRKTGGWGSFDWGWKSSVKGKKPPTELTISVDWTITLPDWSGLSKAPKECQEAWKSMLKSLEAHENEHLDVMRKSAKQLEKDLKKNPPATSQDALDAAQAWADGHGDEQVKFDKKSDHGQKDGLKLDIPEICG